MLNEKFENLNKLGACTENFVGTIATKYSETDEDADLQNTNTDMKCLAWLENNQSKSTDLVESSILNNSVNALPSTSKFSTLGNCNNLENQRIEDNKKTEPIDDVYVIDDDESRSRSSTPDSAATQCYTVKVERKPDLNDIIDLCDSPDLDCIPYSTIIYVNNDHRTDEPGMQKDYKPYFGDITHFQNSRSSTPDSQKTIIYEDSNIVV